MAALQEYGVERVIFTPHRTDPYFQNTIEGIQPKFDLLKAEIAKAGLTIEAEDFSFEYRLDEGFKNLYEAGKYGEPLCKVKPLRGRYLLIENSFSRPLVTMDQIVYDLQSRGYYPVLAHPERYLYYAERNRRGYEHLQEMQVEFQCNLLSFAGYYGETSKRMAYWMLEQGYVSFLGSDLHNLHHVELIAKFLRTKDYASIREDLEDMINNDKI